MEKKRNPNSHSHESFWSELPLDLLNLVFERLGFPDFQRAKSVCSSWYSSSTQSVPKNQIVPWLILFPENKSNSWMLFNPEEKEKLYKTKNLGLEFAKSVCLATYGSWLLMQDPLKSLYIVNLFTHERIINLPPVDSQVGFLVSKDYYKRDIDVLSPVFWIDDKTKDYVVILKIGTWCVVYSKKGDNLWKQIPDSSSTFNMVYKDHKLYFSSGINHFRIYDFSGQIPQQLFRFNIIRSYFRPDYGYSIVYNYIKLVVTVKGDVLRVFRVLQRESGICSFRVYKVYSSDSGSLKEYEQVDSLDDEAMLLDLGITVFANGIEGINRNSIYFSDEKNTNDIFLFNLETREMELLHKFDCSPVQLSSARWFLPSFKRK